jgi:hypothetical protein
MDWSLCLLWPILHALHPLKALFETDFRLFDLADTARARSVAREHHADPRIVDEHRLLSQNGQVRPPCDAGQGQAPRRGY